MSEWTRFGLVVAFCLAAWVVETWNQWQLKRHREAMRGVYWHRRR